MWRAPVIFFYQSTLRLLFSWYIAASVYGGVGVGSECGKEQSGDQRHILLHADRAKSHRTGYSGRRQVCSSSNSFHCDRVFSQADAGCAQILPAPGISEREQSGHCRCRRCGRVQAPRVSTHATYIALNVGVNGRGKYMHTYCRVRVSTFHGITHNASFSTPRVSAERLPGAIFSKRETQQYDRNDLFILAGPLL